MKPSEHRRNIKRRAIEYKGGKCQKCGYSKSVYSLDFHHINPKKKSFVISAQIRKWEAIVEELNKCVLVCKNCHSEIHDEIFKNNKREILKKILNKE